MSAQTTFNIMEDQIFLTEIKATALVPTDSPNFRNSVSLRAVYVRDVHLW